MARDGLRLLVRAGVLLAALPLAALAADDDPRLNGLLAVQKALQVGQEQLKKGNFEAAVYTLEGQLQHVNGHRDYLATLRDAYVGYVAELERTNRSAEAARYRRRAEILDPGLTLEKNVRPASLAAPTPAVPAPTPRPPATLPLPGKVRGKVEDAPDPFHKNNTQQRFDAKAALDRAEQHFAGREYEAAGRLFQQASELDREVTVGSQERWAYCKLFAVVEALNRTSGTPPAELEREVRQAMTMAPKLEAFGNDLVRKIQERGSGVARLDAPLTIEVKHTAKQGNGWALAETANCRVFHHLPREDAERVARAAEAARAAAGRKWFGDPGDTWNPRCDVYLHETGDDYQRSTGVPGKSPGHSTIRHEGERVVARRIDLHRDDPNTEIGVLPHEMTHVVLAGRVSSQPVPRWADEGMAVLAEPRERINLHLRNLPKHERDGQLFRIGQLLKLDDYPQPSQVGAFYAQSVSVVEYLTTLKGPEAFTRFLRDGMRGDYEAALKKHYGIGNFDALERDWRQQALTDAAAQK